MREFTASTGWKLDRIGVSQAIDRDGDGAPLAERGVVEIYPAGVPALWGQPLKG